MSSYDNATTARHRRNLRSATLRRQNEPRDPRIICLAKIGRAKADALRDVEKKRVEERIQELSVMLERVRNCQRKAPEGPWLK